MDTATKAESEISALASAVGCSPAGELFIKQALDPFCDDLRDPVGMPDMEIGNSVVQHIKRSYTYSVGASAQDVHVFLDNLDTEVQLAENTRYTDGVGISQNFLADATGASITRRGGVRIRAGPVGAALTQDNDFDHGGVLALPQNFANGGSTRVCAKAIEIHNVTNKLNVGGSVTVYRATGDIPYNKTTVGVLRNVTNPTTISNSLATRKCSIAPLTEADAVAYPGSQTWDAESGCYIVAMPAAQTNEVNDDETSTLVQGEPSTANPTKTWINVVAANVVPRVLVGVNKVFSPFFVTGAYLTGLPANTQLKINVIYYVERFIESNTGNIDLVTMGKPSPYFDPKALELYAKTAQHMPVGTKVKNNADGDWIKNVADMLGTFGVPGMPFVKGAVDLWNGLPSLSGDVGSPSKSSIVAGNRARKARKGNNNNSQKQNKEKKMIENAVNQAISRQSPWDAFVANGTIPQKQGGKNKKNKRRNKSSGKQPSLLAVSVRRKMSAPPSASPVQFKMTEPDPNMEAFPLRCTAKVRMDNGIIFEYAVCGSLDDCFAYVDEDEYSYYSFCAHHLSNDRWFMRFYSFREFETADSVKEPLSEEAKVILITWAAKYLRECRDRLGRNGTFYGVPPGDDALKPFQVATDEVKVHKPHCMCDDCY